MVTKCTENIRQQSTLSMQDFVPIHSFHEKPSNSRYLVEIFLVWTELVDWQTNIAIHRATVWLKIRKLGFHPQITDNKNVIFQLK